MAARAPSTLPGGLDLDLAMLRVMYAAQGVSISGIDPRLNPSRVAKELGVSRARVAARLRAWTEHGFLTRYDVWPNPHLFQQTGATFDVRVADRLAKEEVLARIGLIPGAVGGMDFLGDWLAATFVLPREDDPRRIGALVRGLAGVAEAGEAVPWAPPDSERSLTPLELRIVRVLREFPTASLAVVARHVGVSTRTITSRYAKLLDEHAVWFVPILDFRALAEPVLNLNLEFRSVADRAAFGEALKRAYPLSLEFRRTQFGPALPATIGSFFVVGGSAARTEEIETWIRSNPGIRSQEALTMKRLYSFPETFDRLLARAAPADTRPRRATG